MHIAKYSKILYKLNGLSYSGHSNNKEKKIICQDNRQSEGGEDHLTEEENDDCCITLGERLHMAAKMVFLYPELLSPSPHYPEWINTWIEGQTIFSEGGEDQSEISDESEEGEWLDDSIYKNDVDVKNRDVKSDIKN